MTLQERIARARQRASQAERIACEANDEALGCEVAGNDKRLDYLNEKAERWEEQHRIWNGTLMVLLEEALIT